MKKLIMIVVSLFCLFSLATPALVYAADPAPTTKDAVCEGVGLAGGGKSCDVPAGSPTVESTLATGINILSFVVGVAAVFMIIIGGIKFITAGGEPGKVSNARDTILYSVIGLAVAASAQLIVRFVLTKTN